jgi:carbon-monoxide dehydrogenase large subunit
VSTQTAGETTHFVGQPVRRKEDARIITGQARWTDNLSVPGLLHMAIARSPVAHARISGTDISAALRQLSTPSQPIRASPASWRSEPLTGC